MHAKVSKPDPVVAIGRLIAEHTDCHNKLEREAWEAARAKRFSEEIYKRREVAHLSDRIDALTDYVSTIRANSIEGAIIQIAVASDLFESLVSNDLEQHQIDQKSLKFDRLIHSAITALGLGPDDLRALGVCRYLSESSNPWEPVEKRIAAIRKDAA